MSPASELLRVLRRCAGQYSETRSAHLRNQRGADKVVGGRSHIRFQSEFRGDLCCACRVMTDTGLIAQKQQFGLKLCDRLQVVLLALDCHPLHPCSRWKDSMRAAGIVDIGTARKKPILPYSTRMRGLCSNAIRTAAPAFILAWQGFLPFRSVGHERHQTRRCWQRSFRTGSTSVSVSSSAIIRKNAERSQRARCSTDTAPNGCPSFRLASQLRRIPPRPSLHQSDTVRCRNLC